jgi:hypothetical protein
VEVQALHQGGAGLVQAHDLHRDAVVAELQHHPVEGDDAGDVPEMRVADIDDDLLQIILAEVEGAVEGLGRENDSGAHDCGRGMFSAHEHDDPDRAGYRPFSRRREITLAV